MRATLSPLAESYRVERRIGRGGMAEVFLARVVGGPQAGRPVALKRLLPALAADPEHLELFAREVALARRLVHPAVVQVIDTGLDGGVPCLVMEYVDGCDLGRLLAACRARALGLPLDFALHVADVVAGALEHAHRARDEAGRPLGVVHCDVSPGNVFLSRAGEVKLGDFGVARAAADGPGLATFGKVRYLAPEQLRGEAVGPRTDVFGLGAVLYELLTCRPAFAGGDADAVARAILAGDCRPPSTHRPEVPPAVDALVLRALAPQGRYPDARSLAADLAAQYDPAVGNPLAIAALVRMLLPPAAAPSTSGKKPG